MIRNPLLHLALVIVGVLALILLIWFLGPFVAIAGIAPFEDVLPRLIACALVLVLGAAAIVWDVLRRRRARAAIAAGLTDAASDDGEVLAERMKGALATLRSTRSKGDFLYDLPWYVLIGPPGSGKTTALVNSGLRFPLAGPGGPKALAGVGGTRYCDWWFTEQAVLIDTAGRYTSQDSDARADRTSWLGFLDLLKRNRPRQPLNGVLVVMAITDLLDGDEALQMHGARVRARLAELEDRLKVALPVYVLFTKMDLIAGFRDHFARTTEPQRRAVWGSTFEPARERTENLVARSPAAFDELAERLGAGLADRLQEEPAGPLRVSIFGFPAQFATLRTPVTRFLDSVFEPTRYRSNATLRGFYFTSGTQEGSPIDRVIGALGRTLDTGAGRLSGRGRSYFLTDLIGRVIVGEAGWVSTDRSAVRRSRLVRAGICGLVLAGLAGALSLWTLSGAGNQRLISDTRAEIAGYRDRAAPELKRTEISDSQFEDILPLLASMRALPLGYASRGTPAPGDTGFGLSQVDDLRSASEAGYRAALERFLRPRLLFRLEEVLGTQRHSTDPASRGPLYDTLKVYLMLGNQGPLDPALVRDWFQDDFSRTLYPGPERAAMRADLDAHIAALIELDSGTGGTIALNGPLVEDARRILVRMNVAERAYQMLKSRARAITGVADWQPAGLGLDMDTVFAAAGGSALDSVRVSGFFTAAGFHRALLAPLPDVARQLESERWVLGESSVQTLVADQFRTLPDDILALYGQDFTATWATALGRLRLKPLTATPPAYPALAALASAASPLTLMVQSVATATDLNAPVPAEGAAAGAPATPIFTGQSSAGKALDLQFRPFRQLVEGDPGARLTDRLQATFEALYQGLVAGTQTALPQAADPGRVSTQVTALRALANRFPAPFDTLLRGAADEFEGNMAASVVADLQASLANTITPACLAITKGRYPFSRGSDRDVPVADFARLFAPNGLLPQFFTTRLESFVDRSGPVWRWRGDTRVGALLSPATLAAFQKAEAIRQAFFAAGEEMPGFVFTIQTTTPTDEGTLLTTDINGVRFTAPKLAGPVEFGAPPPQTTRLNPPTTVVWPGPPGSGRFAIEGMSVFVSQADVYLEKTGPWALFRVIDGSSVTPASDVLKLTVRTRGPTVGYLLRRSTLVDPLTLTDLRTFQCPQRLQ